MKNIYKLAIIFSIILAPLMTARAEDLKSSINDYRKIKKNLTITPIPNPDGTPALTTPDLKKQQLTKIISLLIQIENDQKNQVAALVSFNQLQKDQLTQILQSSVGDLMSKAAKIEATESPEKLKLLAADVLNSWNSDQLEFKKNLFSILNAQINNASSLFNLQIESLQQKYTALKTKNKDVSLLATKIADCAEKSSALKTLNTQIDAKLSTLTKDSDFTNGFQDILNTANQTTAAFQSLRQSIFDATTEANRLGARQ